MNCAVPFEEDEKNLGIWFLDHNYHEAMFHMFKRINGMVWFGFGFGFGLVAREKGNSCALGSVCLDAALISFSFGFCFQPRSM